MFANGVGNVFSGTTLVAADVIKVLDGATHAALGMEYEIKHLLALRFGYLTGYEERSLQGGFGIKVRRYQLDYGYVPFASDMGNSHRVSLSVNF